MGDPLSISASILGIVSLGIQVCSGLCDYYQAFSGQEADVGKTLQRLNEILGALQSLDEILGQKIFDANSKNLVRRIEVSIKNCTEAIEELKHELNKFKKSPQKDVKAILTATVRRLAYPLQKPTLDKLDKDIGKIRRNLSFILEILHLKDDTKTFDEVRETKELVALVNTVQISESILGWFKAPDPTSDHYDACSKRHPFSGLWFINGEPFDDWLEGKSPFLWINGFAGTGKSVLCSTAIQYVLRRRRTNLKIGVAFFYCSFNDTSKQDLAGLLRAVILQLSNQLDNDYVHLHSLHSKYKTGNVPQPELVDTLRALISGFQQVYLVIDAIDESPKLYARNEVLKTLFDFSKWQIPELRVLATSRNEPDIREYISHFSNEVQMNKEEIDNDIAVYVEHQLKEQLEYQSWAHHHDYIKAELVSKAKGVFRWVELQLKSLPFCPRKKVFLDKYLASLPPSLDETYARMLSSIEPNLKDEAKRILELLCLAKRPLTWTQIIEYLAVQLGDKPHLSSQRKVEDADDVSRICPGLIEVNTTRDSTVNLAHLSVKDYLLSDNIQGAQEVAYFHVSPLYAHGDIASRCLVYLQSPEVENMEPHSFIWSHLLFARYAAECWDEHYENTLEKHDLATKLALRLFSTNKTAFHKWIQIFDPRSGRSTFRQHAYREAIPSPVYYASLLGLNKILMDLLNSKHETTGNCFQPNDRNIAEIDNDFALLAASKNGHIETVQILLNNGANINLETEYGDSALREASCKGDVGMVQLLINRGANIEPELDGSESALCEAAYQGNKEVAQILLEGGANINRPGTFGSPLTYACMGAEMEMLQFLIEWAIKSNIDLDETFQSKNVIWLASRSGNLDLVRLLLDRGANVHEHDQEYALCAASERGSIEIVQLLIDRGTDINGYQSSVPLYDAFRGGHIEVVQLLLDGGANLEETEIQYLLYTACEKGYIDIVKLLLDRGASFEGTEFYNPLYAASTGGWRDIVQLLLHKGAKVDGYKSQIPSCAASHGGYKDVIKLLIDNGAKVDGYGLKNPLCAASYGGHKDVVELLLDRGAKINGYNSRNPLHAASYNGNKDVVELLLDKGAKVDGYKAWNPLEGACLFGRKDVVELLLNREADVNGCGGKEGSRTPLELARKRGHEDVVELLIRRGAK